MTQEPVIPGFHVLSDPVRLQIVGVLQDEELSINDMCSKLNTSQSQLSGHLKVLKLARLVTVRKQGRCVYYRLNQEQLDFL